MKKYVLLLAIAFIISINSSSFSQDTNSAKYFPLNIGNTWYYKTTYSPFPFPPTFHKDYIEKDSIINGKTYFKFYQHGSVSYIRVDSTNGNLLAHSPGNGCGSYLNDKIIDSLASSPGDQFNCIYQLINLRRCVSISNVTIFGIITERKSFFHDGLIVENVEYAKNFGVIYSCSGEPPPCQNFTNLIGCKINGVVYGDTVMTDVHQLSSVVPDKFSLSQNYPNPFNPKTIINYQLPASRGEAINNVVNLKVYNALGKEVATLVNEKQTAGSYSVEFNGEILPSGVYFYKLEAGDFVETKRLVLLK